MAGPGAGGARLAEGTETQGGGRAADWTLGSASLLPPFRERPGADGGVRCGPRLAQSLAGACPRAVRAAARQVTSFARLGP